MHLNPKAVIALVASIGLVGVWCVPASAASFASSVDAPTTTEPVGALPEWASGELVTVESDIGPLQLPIELVPFCESSRSFYIAAKGLDFVDVGQAGTMQQLFAALNALVPVTIETAPSAQFAVHPTEAGEQLGVLVPALEQIDYDGSRLQELTNPQAVLDSLDDFVETRESLQEFLVAVCGADDTVLTEQAQEATRAAAAAVGETVESTAPVEAVEGVPLTNENSTIVVSVPESWNDVEERVDNGYDVLVASPDVEGFDDLTTPGVLVLRGEGGFRDGGFVGRVLETQADLEAAGCVQTGDEFYFDNTYTGEERTFDCGNEGLDVRIFGGTTEDESLYAMVLLVQPVDEPGVRQLVVETFLVS